MEDRDNLRWTGCKVDTGCPRGCPSPPQHDGVGRVGGWQDHCGVAGYLVSWSLVKYGGNWGQEKALLRRA